MKANLYAVGKGGGGDNNEACCHIKGSHRGGRAEGCRGHKIPLRTFRKIGTRKESRRRRQSGMKAKGSLATNHFKARVERLGTRKGTVDRKKGNKLRKRELNPRNLLLWKFNSRGPGRYTLRSAFHNAGDESSPGKLKEVNQSFRVLRASRKRGPRRGDIQQGKWMKKNE